MSRTTLMLLALAGCHKAGVDDPPKQIESTPAACRTEPLAGLIGRQADAALRADALRGSGAKDIRVIGPDDAVTMDYRPDRLNALTDAQGVVTGFRCG